MELNFKNALNELKIIGKMAEINPPTIYPRKSIMPINKDLKISKIDEGPHKGQYIVVIDEGPPYWGPIMSKKQAEEVRSRFLNSGKSFEEFVEEWL
jgi:hypothetical protein